MLARCSAFAPGAPRAGRAAVSRPLRYGAAASRGALARRARGAARPGGGGGGGASELTPEAKLLLSIAIDLVGMSTYAVPVAGESADLGWAPVSAALIFWL